MDNVTSIKALLSQISPKGPVLIKGKVISSSPLRIQALNDEKLIMSEKTLVVPGRIGKLNPGELVHIIVFNNSKVFYVLDKV